MANLRSRRLTLLYGESGIGKSSLLNAGVASELKGLARESLGKAARPNMLVAVFSSWRDDPVGGLAEAVYASLRGLIGDRAGERAPRSQPLGETLNSYGERLGGTLLVILDQFEEYFVYHPTEDGAGTFAEEFPRAVGDERLRARFLLAIREDALAKLDRFKGRIPNLFESYLRVGHLDRESARAAIVKPIQRFNEDAGGEPFSIEPELVEAVLDQVSTGEVALEQGGPGTLSTRGAPDEVSAIETPYLQLVLTRLWQEEARQGSRRLRLATLKGLGGAETIARTHLDHALERLSAAEQDVAADAFRYLVTPAGTKIAHTIPTLAEWTEHPDTELTPVLERLSDPHVRIVRPVAGPIDEPGVARYEIFHDVLGPAVLDWRRRHAQARLEREKEAAERSARTEGRRARTFRALTIVFFVLAAVATAAAVAAAVWAFHQRDKAVDQRNVARALRSAAEALAILPDDPRLSLALAVSSVQALPTPSGIQALQVAFTASPTRAVLRGHINWVNTVRWSPDGRYLLTAGDDRSARIWDTRTAREVKRLVGHTSFVNMAGWSSDGRRVVTAGDSTARIWDWQNPNPKPLILRVGPANKDCGDTETCVNVAEFGGPHSEYVLTASFDNNIRVWDSKLGKPLDKRHFERLHTAAIDPTGTRVLEMETLEGRIYQWHNRNAKPVVINRPDTDGTHTQTDTINGVAFSDDGRYVITGSEDKTVVVWDARTGDKIVQLFGPREGLNGVAMSPDGRFVAAGSKGVALYLWEWKAENRLPKFLGHTDVVSDVAFSPDGKLVATASGDRTARIWAVPRVQAIVHRQPVNWAAWSPNGKYAVTASSECKSKPFICKAFLWDVSDPKAEPRFVKVLAKHTDWVTGAGFSRDSSKVVTGGDDDTVRIWSVPDGRQLAVSRAQTDWLTSASFDLSGRLVVSSSLDGTARIWDWQKLRAIRTIRAGDSVGSASFDPSGRFLLTTAGTPHDYTVKVWDWRNSADRPFRVLRGHSGRVARAEWSPDGRYVVAQRQNVPRLGLAGGENRRGSRWRRSRVDRRGLQSERALGRHGRHGRIGAGLGLAAGPDRRDRHRPPGSRELGGVQPRQPPDPDLERRLVGRHLSVRNVSAFIGAAAERCSSEGLEDDHSDRAPVNRGGIGSRSGCGTSPDRSR